MNENEIALLLWILRGLLGFGGIMVIWYVRIIYVKTHETLPEDIRAVKAHADARLTEERDRAASAVETLRTESDETYASREWVMRMDQQWEKTFGRFLEDRKQMHEENKGTMEAIRTDIRDLRTEMRNTIERVYDRIERQP